MNNNDIFTKTYLNIINEDIKEDHDQEFKNAAINTLNKALATNEFNQNADGALSILLYYMNDLNMDFTDEEKEIIENARKLKHGELNNKTTEAEI